MFYFFSYFYSKTSWTIQKWGNFYKIFYFVSLDLGFRSKNIFFCSFWLIFYNLDPDPWFRIFLRIRIQEAKSLGIQRIRILRTELDISQLNQIKIFQILCLNTVDVSGIPHSQWDPLDTGASLTLNGKSYCKNENRCKV